MRIFNLSDETPPYKPERKARTLKIRGVKIEAGGSSEVPDSVPISEFSGLVSTNMVSIDYVPQWYTKAKQVRADRSMPTRAELDESVEED